MNPEKVEKFSSGSEWRKWDPHVHTKGTVKNDQFTSKTFDEFCIVFFKKAIENEIKAIGITDYFNIENYLKVIAFRKNINSLNVFTEEEKEKIKGIFIFPNIELRMLPVTNAEKLVNIHIIVNPYYVDDLDNDFFNSLKVSPKTGISYPMNKKGITDFGRAQDKKLDNNAAYSKGIDTLFIAPNDVKDILEKNKNFRNNTIIAVSNSNKDGASGLQEHFSFFEGLKEGSLDAVRSQIYCLSDCIFSSNESDIAYFSGKKIDNEKEVIRKCGSLKPCIHGSDAHTEKNLFAPANNKYCWVKADLTFEGLKQIIYEPQPGERVSIGQMEPDSKDNFKVIRRINFSGTKDFPEKVYFNKNLNAIIGSRSSGKSALLAYLADSINSTQTRELKPEGPGDGFSWDKVRFTYEIEWWNGRNCIENPGSIVFIPQNFLYEISRDPQKIKEKIKPVLFTKLPKIAAKYKSIEISIQNVNDEIIDLLNSWFDLRTSKDRIQKDLREIGAQASIQKEINKIDQNIKSIQEKFKLDEFDLQKYRNINEDLSNIDTRLKQIEDELISLGGEESDLIKISSVNIELVPPYKNLPVNLQQRVDDVLEKRKAEIISELNSLFKVYRDEVAAEHKKISNDKEKILKDNKDLIEMNKKNIELDALIKRNNDYRQKIEEINGLVLTTEKTQHRLDENRESISKKISERGKFFDELKKSLDEIDQSMFEEMEFAFEFSFSKIEKERVVEKINMKEASRFVENHELDIDRVRERPAEFLEDVYSEELKINKGFEKLDAVRGALTLSEEILISAKMEGDRIGGNAETTMTAGKRALFALRLILAESDDKWPLLIDQPEDDLDSRSIFNEIVPFLRKKKKDRQIIMVSHNANLVIGSDSESIIVANRNGADRKNSDGKQFNYLSGSIENTIPQKEDCEDTLLSQGIREHACSILEGGEKAFEKRIKKYHLS